MALTWEITSFCCLVTLNVSLDGGRRNRVGFRLGALRVIETSGLGRHRRPREQTKAWPGEAGAPQVACRVQTPLPLGGLSKWIGSITDGRVGDGARVGLGRQVNI